MLIQPSLAFHIQQNSVGIVKAGDFTRIVLNGETLLLYSPSLDFKNLIIPANISIWLLMIIASDGIQRN